MSQLENVRQTLIQMKPELEKKYSLSSIGLFGSIVRDDFSESSDIDIIVEFKQPIGIEFIDLALELEMKLNKKVDLVSKKGIKEKYFDHIRNEIIYV